MQYKIFLYEPATGIFREYLEDYEYEEDDLDEEGKVYLWREGNFSCSCNRSLFLHDWTVEYKCGEGEILARVSDAETGRIVYSEFAGDVARPLIRFLD